jgi:hypothetical protein
MIFGKFHILHFTVLLFYIFLFDFFEDLLDRIKIQANVLPHLFCKDMIFFESGIGH